jgi:serine/threonine-protein kinase
MSESHAAAGVREGDVLAGKYRVDRVLGVGGMGVVVAAHHVELDDRVAIKFLLPEALHNGEAVARFAREAQAAVKIKSEHVARVTDVGRLENGAPYIVMEYLEGLDLSAWLQQRGPLPVPQAVEFVLQACEAIAEAHVLGIVHRDLKPANLFVIRRPDGGLSVKVLDFGIAKRIGAAPSANMTSTKAVMGSPLYMSPEQLTSTKDADARTDVWALGVILYELLSGETPFLAETMPGVMMKIAGTEPPPLRARRPEIPAALERVVLTCLAKDRAKRFQTIGDLAVALVDFGPPRARISVERITGDLERVRSFARRFRGNFGSRRPSRELGGHHRRLEPRHAVEQEEPERLVRRCGVWRVGVDLRHLVRIRSRRRLARRSRDCGRACRSARGFRRARTNAELCRQRHSRAGQCTTCRACGERRCTRVISERCARAIGKLCARVFGNRPGRRSQSSRRSSEAPAACAQTNRSGAFGW